MSQGITPESTVEIVNKDPSKPGIVSIGPKPNVPQFIDTTPNWCDKTTWHYNAKQRTGVTLTLDSGKIYHYLNPDDSNNVAPFWIDQINRKMYRGHFRHKDKIVKVYDNGTEVVVAKKGEDKETSGVDCEVDHQAGTVEFATAYSVVGPVTADFWHIDPTISASKQSEYVLCLIKDKDNVIEYVEPQFTKGVEVADNVIFSAFLTANWIAIQTDNTLDPVAVCIAAGKSEIFDGAAFRIDDSVNLHANFGTISGVGDGDIVIYLTNRDCNLPDGFVIWFDASENPTDTGFGVIDGQLATHHWNGSTWVQEAYYPSKLEIPEVREEYPDGWSFLEHATGNYPVIPAGFFGGPNGVDKDVMQLKFDWTGARHLNDKLGVEFRVWLENGIVFGPNTTHKASASFYGQVHKVV